jgi:hypothetical protein
MKTIGNANSKLNNNNSIIHFLRHAFDWRIREKSINGYEMSKAFVLKDREKV